MRDILVTGGAGFIGSNLVAHLLGRGDHVVCLDNFDDYYDPRIKRNNIAPYLKDENFTLAEGDVRDTALLREIFDKGIDKVVHLAARPGVRGSSDSLLYEDINLKGTLNLLEVCKDYDIENFIFGSSSSVYGTNEKVPFGEEDRIHKTISPYAASKRACELFCYMFHHLYNIPIACLRFFTVYGPRQRPDMAIHKFTRLIDEGKEIAILGDPASKRDYTYVTDIIEGVVSALDKNFAFEIFNLGDSNTVELRYLVSIIEGSLGKKAEVKYYPPHPSDVPITYADISKSKRILGYEPKVSIEEGIDRFISWFKYNK